MQQSEASKTPVRRRLLMLATVIVLFGLILALVRGLAREILVEPLLYALWSLQSLLVSLPEALLWGLVVFAAFVIGLRSLADTPTFQFTGRRYRERYGRVEGWVRLLGQARREDYARWRLAQRIAHLASELVVERERIDPRQARHALEHTTADLPSDVRAFFHSGLTSFRPRERGLGSLLRASSADPLKLDPARAVEFLERYYATTNGKLAVRPTEHRSDAPSVR
jgi:hypothetical protein